MKYWKKEYKLTGARFIKRTTGQNFQDWVASKDAINQAKLKIIAD